MFRKTSLVKSTRTMETSYFMERGYERALLYSKIDIEGRLRPNNQECGEKEMYGPYLVDSVVKDTVNEIE